MLKAMPLNHAQIKALSDICQGIAQVSLASIAIPYIVSSPNISFAMIGVIITLAFWYLSLIVLQTSKP